MLCGLTGRYQCFKGMYTWLPYCKVVMVCAVPRENDKISNQRKNMLRKVSEETERLSCNTHYRPFECYTEMNMDDDNLGHWERWERHIKF
jgi:hypothetical protein